MTRRDRSHAHTSKAPAPTQDESASREPSSGQPLELGDLSIDRAGEIPIGVQLAWALRARIGDGRLRPGQRLPGLRELAEILGINANTARGVYQRLEREGLIDSRQGTGTFVTSTAVEPSTVGEIAADAAREARRTGVDPRDVAAALYVTTAEPRSDPSTHAAERRGELRAQIAALERTLSEIQSRHPTLIPTPSISLGHAGPRLLGVEELEGVRTELVRRLAVTQPLLDTHDEETPAHPRQAKSRVAGASVNRPKPSEQKQAPRPRPTTRPSTA